MARKERKDNDERQAIQCGDPNMGPSFPWRVMLVEVAMHTETTDFHVAIV